MASSPAFAATFLGGVAAIATANTNRDGTTGTYGTVCTAVTAGLIESLSIVASGTTTAGVVRIFVNGRLILEQLVPAITPSTTLAVFSAYFTSRSHPHIFPLRLDVGDVLKASTNNAEGFNVRAAGGQL